MKKEEAWKKYMDFIDDPCIMCVYRPPRDRSICGDCVSTDGKGRAMERIKKMELETGFKMKYQDYNPDTSVERWEMEEI